MIRLSTPGTLAPLTILMMLAMAKPLQSQIVEGRLTSAEHGAPLSSTYVILVQDSAGEVARSVTDADGLFRLGVEHEGEYFVRAELVGFDASPSSRFMANTDRSTHVDYDVVLSPVHIDLAADRPARCETIDASLTGRIWGEATKALRATQETRRHGHLTFRAQLFRRALRLDGRVAQETDSILVDVSGTPFLDYSSEDVTGRSGRSYRYAISPQHIVFGWTIGQRSVSSRCGSSRGIVSPSTVSRVRSF